MNWKTLTMFAMFGWLLSDIVAGYYKSIIALLLLIIIIILEFVGIFQEVRPR